MESIQRMFIMVAMNSAHLSRLDLNLLRTLHVLLEEAHVSRAAQRLSLTQSAVSHALGRLRSHFGDPLLVRRGHRMVPTPRALALQAPLRHALATLEQVATPARFDPAQSRGSVRIATTDYGLAVLLPHVLATLEAAAPGLSVTYETIGEDVFERLESGFLDLALTGQEAYRDMRTEALFSERFVLMTRAGHPMTGRAMTLDEFTRWPHVLVDVVHSRLFGVDRLLAQLGRRRRIAIRAPQFLAAPLLARHSDLIVPVPERVARLFAGTMGLVIHEPPPEVDIGRFDYVQMWDPRIDADPLHGWLRERVRDAARRVEAADG